MWIEGNQPWEREKIRACDPYEKLELVHDIIIEQIGRDEKLKDERTGFVASQAPLICKVDFCLE